MSREAFDAFAAVLDSTVFAAVAGRGATFVDVAEVVGVGAGAAAAAAAAAAGAAAAVAGAAAAVVAAAAAVRVAAAGNLGTERKLAAGHSEAERPGILVSLAAQEHNVSVQNQTRSLAHECKISVVIGAAVAEKMANLVYFPKNTLPRCPLALEMDVLDPLEKHSSSALAIRT